MYLLICLSSRFSKKAALFEKFSLNCCTFEKLTKNVLFDCFGFCLLIFEKRPNFQNGQKRQQNRTNMNITLSFLAKPQDKHGITLEHITYQPLVFLTCDFDRAFDGPE